MSKYISASSALAILQAKGIKVSDFTLYAWLESGQISAHRLPSGTGRRKGRWQVDDESLHSFVERYGK